MELAWALATTGRATETLGVLEPELERAAGADRERRQAMEGLLLGACGTVLEATGRLWARAADQRKRALRGELHDPVMLAALALIGSVAGLTAAQASECARRALRDERLMRSLAAYAGAACGLCWAGEVQEAADSLDVALAESHRRGSLPAFMNASVFRGHAAFVAGDLDAAEDHGQRAHELGAELGVGGWSMMFITSVLLERDRPGEALSLFERLAFEEPWLMTWDGAIVLAQRGRAKVAIGELDAGVTDMLDADRRMAAGGCDLSVPVDWVPCAASALAQLGRDREARALADRELAAARRFGERRRFGVALSTCGQLDRGPQGRAWLCQAVERLECSPARLEYARALVNLGSGLRRRGEREDARAPLSEGLDIAYACGSVALADRARAELFAAGARPRRDAASGAAALTPAELRTARMAADGLSNRDIAQALFISMKTVETHLSHAYGKLGITGREQLQPALTGRRHEPRAAMSAARH